ncbi:hypothetical protein AVEN_187288-1 [Araneus ventricosus]|uniref:Uncharacterized protein n=1 Tax=Araneus ventricosus TaxID=182803 RepID=A0A4Y2GVH5_ARAVE|nr:hypothetical protein AVEN_187288-1 [Araneus ventricosus]
MKQILKKKTVVLYTPALQIMLYASHFDEVSSEQMYGTMEIHEVIAYNNLPDLLNDCKPNEGLRVTRLSNITCCHIALVCSLIVRLCRSGFVCSIPS